MHLYSNAKANVTDVHNSPNHTVLNFVTPFRYVCEVAGNQQGLFPGDLGSMGSASIDQEKLDHLKDMLLSEKNLEAFSSMSNSQNTDTTRINDRKGLDRRGGSKKRRRTGAGTEQEHFYPLCKGERQYLELCARILRCLQRLHLANFERSSSKSVDDLLIDECVNSSSPGLGSDTLIDELGFVSSSPWVSCIATASFGHVISSEMKEISPSMEYASSQSPQEIGSAHLSQTESETGAGVENGELLGRLPMLLAIDQNAKELDDSRVIVYLQIISACAEVFPRGECWASTNKWYETTYSPLDPTMDETLGGIVTYCSACSPLDMTAMVYSLSLILSRYGGANASGQVQMWALVCLLKLTESSHISCKYSADNGSSDELTFAWQCVWSRLLQPELRYHSSTAQAEPSSVGEMVLMLLTEIVRGGLVESGSFADLAHAKHSSHVRKNQSKIWNLPIFSTALDLKVSAPFELAAMVISRTGLAEGDADSICSRGSDSSMQLMVKIEAEKGRGRRFRLANFCLQFISQAVKMTEVENIRRISMFCSALFCALLDTKVTDLSSFTMKSFRELKITDHTYHPSSLCLSTKSETIAASDLGLLWEDSMVPFWFQNEIDMDRSIWTKLTCRDIPNCPFWSCSDRSWLASNCVSASRFNASPLQAVADLREYGLKSLSNILYLTTSEDNTATKSCPLTLSCKTAVTKVVLAIALCGDDVQRKKAPWGSIEHCIDSVVNEAMSNVDYLRRSDNEFAYVFTDLIGIIRLVRSVISIEPCAKYIKGVLPTKFCTNLYKLCEKIVRSHAKKQLNSRLKPPKNASSIVHPPDAIDSDFDAIDDKHELTPPSYQLTAFSRSSESDLDKFDSEGETRPKKKKKRKKMNRDRDDNRKYSQGRDINIGDGRNHASDSVSVWICSSIMLHLNPSLESGSVIADAILWPQDTSGDVNSGFDSNEPHDFLLLLGLLYHFAFFYRDERSSGKNNGNISSSTMTLCLDIISQCREISGISSPMHMWGFGVCEALMLKSSDRFSCVLSTEEIEQLMNILQPEGNGALRALKNRPPLRCSQIQAATKCFIHGDPGFHEAFDNIFPKLFVMKSLKDQHPQIRRAGIEGLAAALVLFPIDAQEKIANDAIAVFPPKPALNAKTQEKETFKEWVENKNLSADFIDYKKRSWVENRVAVEMDKVACIGAIARNTLNDELAVEMICALLMISESSRRRRPAFRHLESIAKHRKYRSIEEMLQNTQIHFFRNWISEERSLFTLPVTLTLPSVVRALIRLQVVDSSNSSEDERKSSGKFCTSFVSETAAAEYILQNAPFIVPYIFITNMDLREDIKEILSSTVEQTSQVAEERSFFWNLVSEVAFACTDGDVKTMLKSHFYNIYSHLVPMFLLDSDTELATKVRRNAEDFLNSVSSILKNAQKQIKNSTPSIVLELLLVDMKKELFHGHGNKFPLHFFARGMEHVAKATLDDAGGMHLRGLFHSTSISATECILEVKSILDHTKHPASRLETWNTMDAIVEVVQSDASENNEIGFCVISLLSICLNAKDDDILRLGILRRLEKIITHTTEGTAATTKFEINLYVNKMVSCLIQIHEEYEVDLVESFRSSWKTRRIHNKMGSSFTTNGDDEQTPLQDSMYLEEDDGYDITGFVAQGFDNQIASNVIECISLTYDVLALILDTSATFSAAVQETLDPFPESGLTQADLAALETFNKKCCLMTLKQQFNQARDQRSDVDYIKKVKRFLAISSRFRSTESNNFVLGPRVQDPSAYRKSMLSPEVRSLISALKKLNVEIQAEIEGNKNEPLRTELGQELFQLCDEKYLDEIQVASIQCIGSLGLLSQGVDLRSSTIQETKPKSKQKHTVAGPLSEIYSSAFAMLAKRIQADDIETAINAKNTVKALMSTDDGHSSWSYIHEKSESKRILAPFDHGDTRRYAKVELPEDFLDKLLTRVNKTNEEVKVDNSWCWNDELWLLDDNISYNEWITNLVSAVIICCYGYCDKERDTSSMSIKGTSDFFPACLSMSASKFYKHISSKRMQFSILSQTSPYFLLFRRPSICCHNLSRCNLRPSRHRFKRKL